MESDLQPRRDAPSTVTTDSTTTRLPWPALTVSPPFPTADSAILQAALPAK